MDIGFYRSHNLQIYLNMQSSLLESRYHVLFILPLLYLVEGQAIKALNKYLIMRVNENDLQRY